MSRVRFDVKSSRGPYSIVIGPGAFRELSALLPRHDTASTVVVSCPPVWRAHGRQFPKGVATARPLLIPDGERGKTLQTVARLYEGFVARELDRAATVVAFGGGVVGDVAGFAAASYLRGIGLVQIPTTLLAQVDSAIGGKVGVNLRSGKNLVGAFHPPSLVLCDPTLLSTLPAREFRAGLFEVIKYGVIASRALFDRVASDLPAILARDPNVLTQVIADCCRIKGEIVGVDERESGPRRALNFGHTVGHALEAITGYRRFRHGEAVGYGMLAAARLSVMRGSLDAAHEAELRDLIQRLGALPPVNDLRAADALIAIRRDKKHVARTLHFVLASGLGATVDARDVTPKELRAAMRAVGLRG